MSSMTMSSMMPTSTDSGMSMSGMSDMTMGSMMPSSTASTMSMSGMPDTTMSMMTMGMMTIFNTPNLGLNIFSTAFAPHTTGQYVGAWFFCFFLAVVWRALVLALFKLDTYYVRKYSNVGNKEQAPYCTPMQHIAAWRISTNVPRALLMFLTQGVAYLLMIIVMMMNVGLFFAVMVGYLIGETLFGRVGMHSGSGSGGC